MGVEKPEVYVDFNGRLNIPGGEFYYRVWGSELPIGQRVLATDYDEIESVAAAVSHSKGGTIVRLEW